VLAQEVQALRQDREAERSKTARQSLVNAALADVPEANRGTAALVVEAMLSNHGVRPEAVDVGATAKNFAVLLRANHANLFAVPGSKISAVQVGPNGQPDFSGVRSLAELTPEQVRAIPDGDLSRIINGAASADPNGLVPTNMFQRPQPRQ
jgi:hypothetical protein